MKHDLIELRKHFITSLYEVLSDVISPTPYMKITKGDKVNIKFLDGKGALPNRLSTEITILDLDIASLFFDDIHLLYEGITGIGKTYTSNILFDTIFGEDGHYTIRLSGGLLGGSVLDPFTSTFLDNGLPKTIIDLEKCHQYGAIFIDEINRGDPNELFQVVDGTIYDSLGGKGKLQIPICNEQNQETGKYKKIAIIAAMNPRDAQHTGVMNLDIASENRFLKFQYPNSVYEASCSQLKPKYQHNLYEKFWHTFANKTKLINPHWKHIYPQVTDSTTFTFNFNAEIRELIDVGIGYINNDPIETYLRNAELTREMNIELSFSISEDSNDYKRVREIQNNLKHRFVRRDLKKINDLSRLIAFVQSVKNNSFEYKIDTSDVTASLAIILQSQLINPQKEQDNILLLLNDMKKAYVDLCKEMKVPQNYGIRQSVFDAAIHGGTEGGFENFINTIDYNIQRLNFPSQSIAHRVIKAKLLGDLAVMKHFGEMYEQEITEKLNDTAQNNLQTITELYQKKKKEATIYEHRLDSIFKE